MPCLLEETSSHCWDSQGHFSVEIKTKDCKTGVWNDSCSGARAAGGRFESVSLEWGKSRAKSIILNQAATGCCSRAPCALAWKSQCQTGELDLGGAREEGERLSTGQV